MKTHIQLSTLGQVTIAALLTGLVYLALTAFNAPSSPKTGGYLPRSVTAGSSTVALTDTVIFTATSGLQRFVGINMSATSTFYCAFGATSTLNAGLVFQPLLTSSTVQQQEISDPALLAKGMRCTGSGPGTLVTFYYTSS